MSSSISTLSKKLTKRGALMPIVGALALLLVFLQSTELSHIHADAAQQVQCEICLKVGSSDDVITLDSASLSFGTVRQSFLASTLEFVPLLAPTPAKSRAPPQA